LVKTKQVSQTFCVNFILQEFHVHLVKTRVSVQLNDSLEFVEQFGEMKKYW